MRLRTEARWPARNIMLYMPLTGNNAFYVAVFPTVLSNTLVAGVLPKARGFLTSSPSAVTSPTIDLVVLADCASTSHALPATSGASDSFRSVTVAYNTIQCCMNPAVSLILRKAKRRKSGLANNNYVRVWVFVYVAQSFSVLCHVIK
jgi:hypothetical protein